MRAFLSHSSKDKGYVEDVSSFLKPGTFELDSLTFDKGLLSASAIETALNRCSLFVLFLSEEALSSSYVKFETLVANEFYAKGIIEKILIICLDDTSFSKTTDSLRLHNAIRKAGDASSTARVIAGSLISTSSTHQMRAHPFIGREEELVELQEQFYDLARPDIKALFLSGNRGVGRRSLAKNFFANQFSYVNSIFPEIDVSEFDGVEEIHRKVVREIRPSLTAKELRAVVTGFAIASPSEKTRQVADLVNSLLPVRESMIFYDDGGLLTDAGALEPTIDDIITKVQGRPHSPLTLIAGRMIPKKLRRPEEDIAYCAVRSLSHQIARRLVTGLLKSAAITATKDEIESLIALGEYHPYNYYRIVDDIRETSLKVFLSNPGSVVEWKHRKSTEYLRRLKLLEVDIEILSILNIVPQIDFETLVTCIGETAETIGERVQKLIYDHVLECSFDAYKVSPAVRAAIERDRRFTFTPARRADVLRKIAQSLVVRIEDGLAPVSLLDSAILAEIETAESPSQFVSVLVLPSHYVWLARRHYDRRDFTDAIRLARIALNSRARLSRNGIVAACRFMCLSATRVGDEQSFLEGMSILQHEKRDDWTSSNIEFLLGFNERFRGNLPKAEVHLRESFRLSVDNFSAARELASVCATRGNLADAETFARQAKVHAPDNPYVLDILISVLIRRYGRSAKHSMEIQSLFDALEQVGDEGGKSFFATRKAEFEHLWGSNKVALSLIEGAINKTPRIFDVRRIRAKILLKENNFNEAWNDIKKLKEIVESKSTSERRSNYRGYIEVYAEYLEATGRYHEAKDLYRGNEAFTANEQEKAIKDIETTESYLKNAASDPVRPHR